MRKTIILIAILLSSNAYAEPSNSSDDAMLCSFYAVVASNSMPDLANQKSWKKNADYWIKKSYKLGAKKNETADVVKEAIAEFSELPVDKLMPVSVSLYKAKGCYS